MRCLEHYLNAPPKKQKKVDYDCMPELRLDQGWVLTALDGFGTGAAFSFALS